MEFDFGQSSQPLQFSMGDTSSVLTQLQDNATSLVFPRFLELAKELRVKIWVHLASCPRYIDVRPVALDSLRAYQLSKIPSEEALHQRDFVLATTQPVPGILSANQESRAVALKHYQRPRDTILHLGYDIYCAIPSNIWCNPKVDFLCPIGLREKEHWNEMWSSRNHRPRCAINVARRATDERFNLDAVTLPWRIDVPGATHEDIWLYHCEEDLGALSGAGDFGFVVLDDEVEMKLRVWKALSGAKKELIMGHWENFEQARECYELDCGERGVEVEAGAFDHLAGCPKIKVVALVVGGEMRS